MAGVGVGVHNVGYSYSYGIVGSGGPAAAPCFHMTSYT